MRGNMRGNMRANNIDEIYEESLVELLNKGKQVGNTIELQNFQFTLTDINNNIIKNAARNISLEYILGELSWYVSGDNSVEYISQFGSMWKRLTDDGITNNSAYGYILQHKFGFNQIENAIELLQKDPNSRRVVLNINTPNENVIETKDEPCTIALVLSQRDNKLNCTGIMRSNDIWYGLPYDVIYFTEIQKYVADRLCLEYGEYTHFAASYHMYDRNKEDVHNVIMCNDYLPIDLNVSKMFEVEILKAFKDEVIKNGKENCVEHYKKLTL